MDAIEVDGDRLTINKEAMLMFEPYRFKYLGTDMVAVRTPNSVELLQEYQWEEDKEEIENCQQV